MNWDTTREEHESIRAVAERFRKEFPEFAEPFHMLVMDIEACHCNGTPLKLDEMLVCKLSDFSHDIGGIRRHLDRNTGKLGDCFIPRYAVQ